MVSEKEMVEKLEKYLKAVRFPEDAIANTVDRIIKEGILELEYEIIFGGYRTRTSLSINRDTFESASPESRREFGYERAARTAHIFYDMKAKSRNPNFNILDVGCGEGWFSNAYESQGIDNICVDISRIAVEMSKRSRVEEEIVKTADGGEMKTYRILYDRNTNRDVRRGDVSDLNEIGLKENEFDAVMDGGRMMMQPLVQIILKKKKIGSAKEMCLNDLLQIKRVLKPDGNYRLVTASEKFSKYEPQYANLSKVDLDELMKDAGYEVVNFDTLQNGEMLRYMLRNIK